MRWFSSSPTCSVMRSSGCSSNSSSAKSPYYRSGSEGRILCQCARGSPTLQDLAADGNADLKVRCCHILTNAPRNPKTQLLEKVIKFKRTPRSSSSWGPQQPQPTNLRHPGRLQQFITPDY
jgi:hypothetical protein